eukprot:g65936.t1
MLMLCCAYDMFEVNNIHRLSATCISTPHLSKTCTVKQILEVSPGKFTEFGLSETQMITINLTKAAIEQAVSVACPLNLSFYLTNPGYGVGGRVYVEHQLIANSVLGLTAVRPQTSPAPVVTPGAHMLSMLTMLEIDKYVLPDKPPKRTPRWVYALVLCSILFALASAFAYYRSRRLAAADASFLREAARQEVDWEALMAEGHTEPAIGSSKQALQAGEGKELLAAASKRCKLAKARRLRHDTEPAKPAIGSSKQALQAGEGKLVKSSKQALQAGEGKEVKARASSLPVHTATGSLQ